MFLDDINFKGGLITFNTLNDVYWDFSNGIAIEDLWISEDLMQVEYPHCLLDVGWYGGNYNGFFRVVVVENSDWDSPIFNSVSKNFEQLKTDIVKAVEFVSLTCPPSTSQQPK
jgi:8-oxo-dGTP diphosphatase